MFSKEEKQLIIDEYKRKYSNNLSWSYGYSSIESIVDDFCSKKICKEHLKRRTEEELDNLKKVILANIDKIKSAKSFEELYGIICNITSRIHGISHLTSYDISLPIGYYLGFGPEYIYSHAGTKTGLMNICGIEVKEKIVKAGLGDPFRYCDLSAAQLEDMFCIFKDGVEKDRSCSTDCSTERGKNEKGC